VTTLSNAAARQQAQDDSFAGGGAREKERMKKRNDFNILDNQYNHVVVLIYPDIPRDK
jgi:hypothetical protein